MIRKLLLFFGLLACLGAGSKIDHPFHVAVVTIDHNAAERSLELTCKLFTDDFENELRKRFSVPVDLTNPARHTAMDSLVARYLREELKLTIDGKNQNGSYLGFEQEKEAIYAYIEYPAQKKPATLQLECGLMYRLFTDQVNIFHVTIGGARKSSKLNYPARQIDFNF